MSETSAVEVTVADDAAARTVGGDSPAWARLEDQIAWYDRQSSTTSTGSRASGCFRS